MILHPPLIPMPTVPVGHKHPGSFGFTRKYSNHTGVDLYAPHGTPVFAMEDGIILRVDGFTGPCVDMPWWNDTEVIYVLGNSGIIGYGEVEHDNYLSKGDKISQGDVLGYVLTVLKKYKGRPMSMLHTELYSASMRALVWNSEDRYWDSWKRGTKKHEGMLDPTPMLLSIPGAQPQWNDPYKENSERIWQRIVNREELGFPPLPE